jgi:hypothetical protein
MSSPQFALEQTYNEKFTVQLTKLDGSIATISNR